MLLTVQRTAIRLSGSSDSAPDSVIEQLVNLLPDYSGGRRLHALLVNRLKGALPGNYSQIFGTGPSFRSIFFADYQPDPLLPLMSDMGLDDGWWANFSVAVLCQSIQDLGSRIRGQMRADKINHDVASFNATVRGRCARPYARVLAASFPPLINLLNQVDHATARQQFHDALLGNVINRQLWYQAGMWTSPDWEMFNQYAKYIALGADDAQVDALIDELTAAGLPIPPQVNRSNWRGYAEALRDKPDIDLDDVGGDTAKPIQETTYLPSYGRGMPARMPNGNCYEFTAGGQPGSPFRAPPSSCCLTGDTEVLSGAGVPVPLNQVKPGDTVMTRDGAAVVAFVARPQLGERKLYRINGGGPVFTDTHPFLNASASDSRATAPAILAADPAHLAWMVPTLSEDGIGKLTTGCVLTGRRPESSESFPVDVTTVEPVPRGTGDDYLYDLNLLVTTGARQEFWAGKDGRFYLVSPEFPVLAQAGAAAVAVVAALEGLIAAGGPTLSGWPVTTRELVHRFGAAIFDAGLDAALRTVPSFGSPTPVRPLFERIDKLYRDLGSVDVVGASAIAAFFDGFMSTIVTWLTASVALGWRKPAEPSGEIVVVTIFDMALAPGTPVQTASQIRMEVRAQGQSESASTTMWNRSGRANTRFHHYFDQLIHLDRAKLGATGGLTFAVVMDGASVPALSGAAPLVIGDRAHCFQSAQLFDAAGTAVGTIRFDTRLLTRRTAEDELAHSGLWTEEAALAYSNALGTAMVAPILTTLEGLAGR